MSPQILKAAAIRLRELKPLIELLTATNPLGGGVTEPTVSRPPIVEVELANMLQGIAGVRGSYGGPDYTSVIKTFDPVPLRQTQPPSTTEKQCRTVGGVPPARTFPESRPGKDRYWPCGGLCSAAGIANPSGQPYGPDELKSWWQKLAAHLYAT